MAKALLAPEAGRSDGEAGPLGVGTTGAGVPVPIGTTGAAGVVSGMVALG